MKKIWTHWPTIMLLGLLLPGTAFGRGKAFLDDYKSGLDAVEAEQWSRAAELMRRAIDQRRDESRRLPRYFYLKPYIPHFYLGLAAFKQGDCEAALEAWRETERQGVIQERPEHEQIVLARELCKKPSEPEESTETVAESRPRASPPPPAAPRAAPPARRPERSAAPAPRPTRPERPAPAAAPSFEPEEPDPSTLDRGFSSRRTEPRGEPTPELLDMASAFLAGDHEQVISGIDPQSLDDPYARAQARLLRAAAEFSLYWQGGGKEGARLSAARRHVLDVRAALPELEPPERFFSPRFLDFYYGQRPEEGR